MVLVAESTCTVVETPECEEIVEDVEHEQEVDATPDESVSNPSTQIIPTNEPDAELLVPVAPPSGDPTLVTFPNEPHQDIVTASYSPAPVKISRRKHRRAEGLTSDEDDSDDDEDFTGEEVKRPNRKKRRTPTTSDHRRPSHLRLASVTPSPQTPDTPSTPNMSIDKTRTACIEQFFKLFEPPFFARLGEQEGDVETKKKQSETEATRFAESVESELFESFGELDHKNVKAPRKQYMTKFRSLFFNLKHNPIFLNSLSTAEISPQSIVHMSNQDLQTPEQKAISEQIRQRALHDSVRNVISAPTTKMTHKGEQAIESLDPLESQDAGISGPQLGNSLSRQRSETGGPDPFARSRSSPHPTLDAGQSMTPSTDSRPLSVDQAQLVLVDESKAELQAQLAHDEPSPHPSALEMNDSFGSLNAFDLERVFAAMSSVPSSAIISLDKPSRAGPQSGDKMPDSQNDDADLPSEDNMDLAATPEYEPEINQSTESKEGHLPDDYDPFVVVHGGDADLDAILHGDQSTTPPHTPPTAPLQLVAEAPVPVSLPVLSVPEAVTPKTDTSVWKGNVMTADAGGFAACAIQVGGRPLCTSRGTWDRLFPTETLTVVGRLPVKDSTNYLVQSHFAASRELIVLDLAPNLDGPPDLPSPDRVMHHQQNLIDFFTKKGRHAVVAVHDRAKHVLRDIYLVPLLKQEPLPEFVELLDDVSIKESTPRPKDMILAVLVLQKGALPTAWKPPVASSTRDPQLMSAPAQVPQALLALQSQLQPQSPPHAISPPPKTSNTSVVPPPCRPITSLPYPPSQPSSAPFPTNIAASLPILQSLSTALSAAPQLPFNFFPQNPSPPVPASTTNATSSQGMGPPPGFVPYVAPASTKPSPQTPVSSVAPPSNLVDLSKVDVNALSALLSNPQVFRPPPNPAPRLVPHSLPQHPHNPMAGSSRLNTYSAAFPQSFSIDRSGNLPLIRPAGLPPTPQMPAPWPTRHDAGEHDHRNFNAWGGGPRAQEPAWVSEHVQHTPNEQGGWGPNRERSQSRESFTDPSAAAYRRRIAGGGSIPPNAGKRSAGPQEFVAPPRDSGWAGRGRGKIGGGGNRSVSDHHFQREEDQYSAPIWMGR
ncbi:hypothetical protein CROQUDRAFT_262072 [Cronartium quercuum f. sp. fusiforme G11]|uniref:TFIIS central domain-containing protein n=1 Tax=Cronartium quercuum f. sp. fusiforme G11 TaxID=708437 RepID=A0A9P6TFP9_9BASI|nr:hypothetical protein CROQUDRAFT_262072 [Cronartium quercuum f. sp. fusiforme G11]